MSLKIIRDETGVYVEIPRDKIKFVSKEAEIMFDLSMENDYLENENEELKKQLEEYKLNHKQLKDLDKIQKSFIELKKQQKEFIKYLEDCIKEIEKESFVKLQNELNLGISDITKEFLQRYKEIIGVLDE